MYWYQNIASDKAMTVPFSINMVQFGPLPPLRSRMWESAPLEKFVKLSITQPWIVRFHGFAKCF